MDEQRSDNLSASVCPRCGATRVEPTVWGGGEGCEHVWGAEMLVPQGNPNGGLADTGTGAPGSRRPGLASRAERSSAGQFCTLCGAWRGQLGLEPTPELYVEHLAEVVREVARVLRRDGTLWLNLGDTYASQPRGSDAGWERSRLTNPDTVQKAQAAALRTTGERWRGRASGLKAKDLALVPFRSALALQGFAVLPFRSLLQWADMLAAAREAEDWDLVALVEAMMRAAALPLSLVEQGWWLRQVVVWDKPNAMPNSMDDRPGSSHEYVFLLTRNGAKPLFWTHRDEQRGTRRKPPPDYRWLNEETIQETAEEPPDWRTATFVDDKGEERRLWRRVNLWRGRPYFYDAEAVREPHTSTRWGGPKISQPPTTKYAEATRDGFAGAAEALSRPGREWNAYPVGGRNLRSVWSIPTEPYPDAHFAVFPPSLVRPMILAGTSERGACRVCGAPWARVVETESSWPARKEAGATRGNVAFDGNVGAGTQRAVHGANVSHDLDAKRRETIGWQPTCECGGGLDPKGADAWRAGTPDAWPTVPCVVLDPFAGACTTLLVARSLGRRGVGVELSAEFAALGARRLGDPSAIQEAALAADGPAQLSLLAVE